ncbi:MAG: hypothetical protein ACHQX3_00770 [Nitrospirales bacterium]
METKRESYFYASVALIKSSFDANRPIEQRRMLREKSIQVHEKAKTFPNICSFCHEEIPGNVAPVDHCEKGRAAKPALEAEFDGAMKALAQTLGEPEHTGTGQRRRPRQKL